MFGLNPLTVKVAAGVALVLALMAGVIWWQHGQIKGLNREVGAQAAQIETMASALDAVNKENDTLRYLRDQESRIREQAHADIVALQRQLAKERERSRARIRADAEGAAFLARPLPGVVDQRLSELFPPGGDRDADRIRDHPDGHGEGHAPAGMDAGPGHGHR